MNSILSNLNHYILYICAILILVAAVQLIRLIFGLKKVSTKTSTIITDLDHIAGKAEQISEKEKKIESTFKKTTKSLTAVSILVLISSLLKDRNKIGNKNIIQEYKESNKARKIIYYATKLK